jgi:hypothetical protein
VANEIRLELTKPAPEMAFPIPCRIAFPHLVRLFDFEKEESVLGVDDNVEDDIVELPSPPSSLDFAVAVAVLFSLPVVDFNEVFLPEESQNRCCAPPLYLTIESYPPSPIFRSRVQNEGRSLSRGK